LATAALEYFANERPNPEAFLHNRIGDVPGVKHWLKANAACCDCNLTADEIDPIYATPLFPQRAARESVLLGNPQIRPRICELPRQANLPPKIAPGLIGRDVPMAIR
jgi:hypothetical protein